MLDWKIEAEFMSIVETSSLTKRFGKFVAVDNLSPTVEKGEVFGHHFREPGHVQGRRHKGLMLGAYHFGLLVDLVVLAIFALVVVVIGTLSFRRMKL